MKFEEFVAVNGSVSTLSQAKIPAIDRGFLFGDQIFETIAGFHGQLLDLDDHIERLFSSAEKIRLPLPWRHEELKFELEHLASLSSLPKLAVRAVITRGEGIGLGIPDPPKPTRVFFVLKAASTPESVLRDGLTLQLRGSGQTARGVTAKTGNYLASIVAVDEAKACGYDEILWENSDREITEAATANIFFLAREGDGVWLVTPATDSGILAGITRSRLLALTAKAGIRAEERIVGSDELARFDEAFLTSTVRGLVPVSRIGDHRLFTTRKNSTFRHLRRLYDAYVTSQLGFAVDWNDGRKKETGTGEP